MTPISNDPAACEGDPRVACETTSTPCAAPQLLVSVRDEAEIATALTAGADIVDFKEPRNGPLAPASLELWRHAAALWRRLDPSIPRPWFSAALGEPADAVRIATRLPSEFAFAKVGPSQCDCAEMLLDVWKQVRGLLDDRTELVAVAYADYHAAGCVPPEAVFRLAIDAGFRRCLIDTFTKDGRSTLDHLGIDGLKGIGGIASEGNLWWTLAGSIRVDSVVELRRSGLTPDCFGVRGDVCSQGRTGTLVEGRIKQWKTVLGSPLL